MAGMIVLCFIGLFAVVTSLVMLGAQSYAKEMAKQQQQQKKDDGIESPSK